MLRQRKPNSTSFWLHLRLSLVFKWCSKVGGQNGWIGWVWIWLLMDESNQSISSLIIH